MKKERADEIVRLSFYRHIDNLSSALSRNCDNAEVAFNVGRYVGMMQKDLENELSKEVGEQKMNNRYLYRAKRKSDKKWIYGNLIQTDDGVYIIQNYVPQHFIGKYEVDTSTICQCTGLKDKNVKLIWENDIVNCFEAECCGKISWNESEAGFYFDVLLEDGTYEEEHIYDYADCMEVIGNIFDNPELLSE